MECEKCKKCETMTPISQIAEVMIYSREYVGLMWICDTCYVDVDGNQIRKMPQIPTEEESCLRQRVNLAMFVITMLILLLCFIGSC